MNEGMNEYGELVDDADRGKTEVLGRKKSVPMPLCSNTEPQVYCIKFSTLLVQ
jgi:hypothetical protein